MKKQLLHLKFIKQGLALTVVLTVAQTIGLFGQNITLDSPNGGELWAGGSNQSITWTTALNGTALLSYSENAGSTYVAISNVSLASGSYVWTLPNINSTNCLVKIEEQSIAGNRDASNAVFSISSPTGINVASREWKNSNLYPNPVVSVITVEQPVNIQELIIYNMLGKQCMRMGNINSNKVSVNTQVLEKGVYFINIVNENGGTLIKSFIKM